MIVQGHTSDSVAVVMAADDAGRQLKERERQLRTKLSRMQAERKQLQHQLRQSGPPATRSTEEAPHVPAPPAADAGRQPPSPRKLQSVHEELPRHDASAVVDQHVSGLTPGKLWIEPSPARSRPAVEAPLPPLVPPVPACWFETLDSKGRQVYIHFQTRHVVYERPTADTPIQAPQWVPGVSKEVREWRRKMGKRGEPPPPRRPAQPVKALPCKPYVCVPTPTLPFRCP